MLCENINVVLKHCQLVSSAEIVQHNFIAYTSTGQIIRCLHVGHGMDVNALTRTSTRTSCSEASTLAYMSTSMHVHDVCVWAAAQVIIREGAVNVTEAAVIGVQVAAPLMLACRPLVIRC
jgi:hypothetical protein